MLRAQTEHKVRLGACMDVVYAEKVERMACATPAMWKQGTVLGMAPISFGLLSGRGVELLGWYVSFW